MQAFKGIGIRASRTALTLEQFNSKRRFAMLSRSLSAIPIDPRPRLPTRRSKLTSPFSAA
ncbi:MAG: hypothetical protein OXC26_16570 [Albidovulum sp.]|nr:hypothetical protein [Albidovulum sp.]